jgi:quercetin 2,3-dioxygenase
MMFEYLIEPGQGPRWQGLLPGAPEAFFLSRGEGEHAKLFADLFTVLVSGAETGGQFGIVTSQSPAADIIPTHAHADTHETFYVLDGQVRVFVQDRAGQKTSRLLGPGDFGFVPARPDPRLPGGAGGPDARRAQRPRIRAASRPLSVRAQSSP